MFEKTVRPLHVLMGLCWAVFWVWITEFLTQVFGVSDGSAAISFLAGVGIGFFYSYWRFD